MDGAVATLQNTINRFAVVGGFPRVSVDGFWGAQTKQGVYSALAFVGQGKCYQVACPDADTSRSAAGIMATWDESLNAARGLGEFLGRVADDLGLPLVAAPIPGTGTGPGPIVAPTVYQPGLVERLKMLPLWQQLVLGIAGGLMMIFVVNRFQAAQQSSMKRKRAA
jgi:hypothetical protein